MQDWLAQSKRSRALQSGAANNTAKAGAGNVDTNAAQRTPEKAPPPVKKKLSYKEQRELDLLPSQITALETEQLQLQEALADGALYTSDPARAATMTARAATIEEELMNALERWTALSV